jgi:hypothetical protein
MLNAASIYPSLGSSSNERGNRRLRESLMGGVAVGMKNEAG